MLIQLLLVTLLAVMLLMTWRRARQGVIRSRDAFFWSLLWIAAAVVIVLPQSTTGIARLFGVGRGVDAVIYASVTLIFMLIFKLFLTVDRLDHSLTDVVRKDALRQDAATDPEDTSYVA